MAGYIDRGLDAVKPEQEVLRKQVEEIQEVADTLDPEEGNRAQRQAQFQKLIKRFVAQGDSFHEHLAKVMSSFQPGLFAGGTRWIRSATISIWSAGFAYSKGMSVGSTATNMPVFGSSKRDRPKHWPWTHTGPTADCSPLMTSYLIVRHACPNANVKR